MNPPAPLNNELYHRLSRTLDAIRTAPQPLSLDEVAAHLGLSRAQAQRAFTRGVGLSPQRFQATLTRERALARLAAGSSVFDAAADSGLSGPGRLHDLLVSTVALTPGQAARQGAGAQLRWGQGLTPWGRLAVGWGSLGLVGLGFAEDEAAASLEQGRWQRAWPEATWARDDAGAAVWLGRVSAHLEGRLQGQPLPLVLRGTNFQIRIWEALLALPEGAAASYGSLAKAVGQVRGAQAVGQAVGANLLALLIPCHRVIRADGTLGGYRWGVGRKAVLWAHEDTSEHHQSQHQAGGEGGWPSRKTRRPPPDTAPDVPKDINGPKVCHRSARSQRRAPPNPEQPAAAPRTPGP